MTPNDKRTKYTCYFTNLAAASVFSLPPILFLTFRDMYGISYALLGALVTVNFCIQLGMDLLLSFFGKYVNPHTLLRTMPLMTSAGLLIYAVIPLLFPQHAYAGLLGGTVVFSVAAGLGEVLISPTVAALPSEHPERDMAALHSLYGYGVAMVVIVSTIFLELCGYENWMYLAMLWAVLPVVAGILLFLSPLPPMDIGHAPADKARGKRRNTGIILCVLCIFFGSSAECSMTTWVTAYIEEALHISKVIANLLGLCLFAVLLALTRTWYAKYGKNIWRVLFAGMAASVVCYLVAGLSPVPILSMAACVLTGVCAAMLWPGALIYMEENIPHAGVAAYALMAAGGDLGGSIAPLGIGVIVDSVAASDWVLPLSQSPGISPEQVGMKLGVLLSALFPLLGVGVLLYMRKYFRRNK